MRITRKMSTHSCRREWVFFVALESSILKIKRKCGNDSYDTQNHIDRPVAYACVSHCSLSKITRFRFKVY
jgi:hypothetical protein